MLEVKRLRLVNGDVCFWAHCSFDKKDVAKFAGFKWDSDLKKWVTHQPEVAFRLYEYCDPGTKQVLKKFLGDNAVEFDKSAITWPQGLRPFTHQIEAVKFMCSRKNSYLAGEAGVGKTISATTAMNAKPGKAIIICPAFLKYNWEAEINKWSTRKLKIQILHNQQSRALEDSDVIIYPASLLHHEPIRESIFALGISFQWLFIDEAHYFKSDEAKRTKSLLGGSVSVESRRKKWKGFHTICNHVVALSGTPMPNGRPIELYPILSAHAPFTIGYLNKHAYAEKYCAAFEGEWGWDYSGSSNLPELHEKLKNYMLVQKLDECVDLPEKMPYQFIFMDDDRPKKEQASEMKLLATVKLGDIIKHEAMRDEKFGDKVEYRKESALEAGRELLAGEFLAELRRANGMRKVPGAVSIIKEMIEDGPLIVFAWHQDVIDALADKLYKLEPFVITGKTPHATRHKYVGEFQTSQTRNLLIANIQAAGVGITLTKAARVLFVEPSFVPADNEQAVARVRRIGQTRQVQASFLVWPHSLDHLILNAHQEKSININEVIKE